MCTLDSVCTTCGGSGRIWKGGPEGDPRGNPVCYRCGGSGRWTAWEDRAVARRRS